MATTVLELLIAKQKQLKKQGFKRGANGQTGINVFELAKHSEGVLDNCANLTFIAVNEILKNK